MTQGFSLTLAEQKLPIAAERFASVGSRARESINVLLCQEDEFILIYSRSAISRLRKTAQVLADSFKNFVPLAV